MKNYFLFILFLLIKQATAQVVVSGTTIDAKSKEVLHGVNVYINNTSIGTVTDSLGKFKLTVPNNGKIELIFSHLVYQKKTVVVLPGKNEDIVIEMDLQNNTLNQVVIQGKKVSKTNIINWTELFALNLMGNYKTVSLQCKIKNPEVLYFDYDKQSNLLEVFAKRPILIENAALGYLIRLELDNFKYNFKTDDVVYKYSVFFENLALPGPKMAQIAKKRKQLYAGSNMHFMRALYSNNLDSSGFSVYKYSAVENAERARVYKNVLERIEYTYANQTHPKIDIARLYTSVDTIRYYRSVLQQDKVIRFDTVRLVNSTLSKPNKDWTTVNFNSSDTLMVNYTWIDPGKSNEAAFRTQIDAKSKQFKKEERINHLNWQSYMYFFNKEGINIQSNGFYPELGLFVYGDMGNRRLAGMLPFDYDPNEEL